MSAKATRLPAAERRQAIVESALRVFVGRSYSGTTTAEIAREAGVSAGLIYRHYASKDDLVVAMVEQHQQQELADIAAAAQEPTLAAALDHFFLASLASDELRSEALLYAEVIAEALRNERIEAVVRANSHAVSGALAALIATAQARGEADAALDPALTAELLLAFNDGLLLHNAFGASAATADVERQQQALRALYRRVLGIQQTP